MLIFLASLILCIAFFFGFIQPKMESSTYNKITGAQTTWWDALWLELRVADAPRREGDK